MAYVSSWRDVCSPDALKGPASRSSFHLTAMSDRTGARGTRPPPAPAPASAPCGRACPSTRSPSLTHDAHAHTHAHTQSRAFRRHTDLFPWQRRLRRDSELLQRVPSHGRLLSLWLIVARCLTCSCVRAHNSKDSNKSEDVFLSRLEPGVKTGSDGC